MLYLDFRLYLEDNLLVKVDRASMACSLELRTPFLDHRLIEFAEGLPSQLKVRGFKLKYIFEKSSGALAAQGNRLSAKAWFLRAHSQLDAQ